MIGETNKSSRLYVRNIDYQYIMIMSLDLVKLLIPCTLRSLLPRNGREGHPMTCSVFLTLLG